MLASNVTIVDDYAVDSVEVVLVGATLLIYGSTGLLLYAVLCVALMRQAKTVIAYRYLISNALVDVLLLLQFSIWPGAVILVGHQVVPIELRFVVHAYLDFVWWTAAYHYTLVAWSRMDAVKRPLVYRSQTVGTSMRYCAIPWILGPIQSVVSHLFPWFEIMYLEPKAYSLTFVDYEAYISNGTRVYYTVCHLVLMALPFCIYAFTIYLLLRSRLRVTATVSGGTRSGSSTEKRLLIPCAINTLVFFVGQLLIMIPVVAPKWIGFSVLLVFTTNSFVNPLLYFAFSSSVRLHVKEVLLLRCFFKSKRPTRHQPTQRQNQANNMQASSKV